jgi:methionyl-tRNA formyltransferase
MRIVFMGTPEYAQVSLQALLDQGYQVAGVFTQPDRPKGRGAKVSIPPVKELAVRHGIPVFQPGRIRSEGLDDLMFLRPDICVTAAFGQILSGEILSVPLLGTVNVHASLLPRYRGSSPVSWAIMMGEKETGVTTMLTNKGIDTGDILLQGKTAIGEDETAGELTVRLAAMGASLLIKTLKLIAAGTCPRCPQNEAEMSYYPMLKKETGAILWQKTARQIANQVRGLNPWPGAYTSSPWGTLKILQAKAIREESGARPGGILREIGRDLLVQAGEGILHIKTIQAQGGRAMPTADFLRGHPLPEGGHMENGEQGA